MERPRISSIGPVRQWRIAPTGRATTPWPGLSTGWGASTRPPSRSPRRALGADDARLRFHAGAIALARGDIEAGRLSLRSALDLGPALDPIERIESERLLGR
jgi:hypothetical protein